MHVTASAPGKLVLFGDHAVVHGQPGIVTAVDLRYSVQAECLAEPLLRIETPTLPEFGKCRSRRLAGSIRPRPRMLRQRCDNCWFTH